jgi:hypothetical protein
LFQNSLTLSTTKSKKTRVLLSSVVRDATEVSTVAEVVTVVTASGVVESVVADTLGLPRRMSLALSLRLATSRDPTAAEVARIVVAIEAVREVVSEEVNVVPERAPEVAIARSRRVRLNLLNRASLPMISETEKKEEV